MFLDFDLPDELIAQFPSSRRDESRLMVVARAAGRITHRRFHELIEILTPNDLLILNNTRVLPARLLGHRAVSGGKWEGLFLRELEPGLWELLCQTRGKPQVGETIVIEAGDARLELVLAAKANGRWQARPTTPAPAAELLGRFGHVPLPWYIRKGADTPEDRLRYQTVFAEKQGAVAAPTAGLHFTPELLQGLQDRGVQHAFVTLHVGLGTFQPLQGGDYLAHQMHSEWGELSPETATAIQTARGQGGRIVAVGTTSVRVLESASASGRAEPWQGDTRLYIHPPYTFRSVDALITNFHLPRTTLLLLVNAFAGNDLMRTAYETAIAERYRFFSYGDAMLIV